MRRAARCDHALRAHERLRASRTTRWLKAFGGSAWRYKVLETSLAF